jgi:hypothetical protein
MHQIRIVPGRETRGRKTRGGAEAYAGGDQYAWLVLIASPCQNSTEHTNSKLQCGHNKPKEENKFPPGAAIGMETVGTIVVAVTYNRPVAEMAYVALIAVRDLDDGPRVDVVIYSDTLTPTAETYRLPREWFLVLVDHKAIETWRGQTLIATGG